MQFVCRERVYAIAVRVGGIRGGIEDLGVEMCQCQYGSAEKRQTHSISVVCSQFFIVNFILKSISYMFAFCLMQKKNVYVDNI